MGEDILQYMFIVCISWALENRDLSMHLFCLAVSMRVAFYSLLRPGELLGLHGWDVRLPSAFETVSSAVLAIRTPKTRHKHGRVQFALLQDSCTLHWLRWLTEQLPPSARLWPVGKDRFVSLFRQLVRRCGLEALGLTPSSLRAGGATRLVLLGHDLGRVKFLGRWQSERTLASYIQEAGAHLTWLALTPLQQASVQQVLSEGRAVWQRPPTSSWPLLFSRARQTSALLRHAARKQRA